MSGGHHDIAMVVQYTATGADVTISGNFIGTDSGDDGIMLYQNRDAAHPVDINHNTIGGTDSHDAILATDDGSIFGESDRHTTTDVPA